ncbi:MAG: globin family protein [Thermoleophilia bacterium]
MNELSLAKVLREKQDEIIRRWLDNLDGHIADDFLQMLNTPMGVGVASKLLSYMIEYLKAEEYERADVLHRMREDSREAAFRRSAVGFGLPDIVLTALVFRRSVQEVMLNNIVPSGVDEELLLLNTLMIINLLGDKIVCGEIAGYFAHQEYCQQKQEDRDIA